MLVERVQRRDAGSLTVYTFGGGEGGVSGLQVTCLFEDPLDKGVEV